MDWANCGGCDNILMANNGQAQDVFSFREDVGSNSATSISYNYDVATNQPVREGLWSHIVCVFAQVNLTNNANMLCYLNGQLMQPAVLAPLPLSNPRQYAYLGRSNWPDPSFAGWIDSFYFYPNYAIPAEAAAAHSLFRVRPCSSWSSPLIHATPWVLALCHLMAGRRWM